MAIIYPIAFGNIPTAGYRRTGIAAFLRCHLYQQAC